MGLIDCYHYYSNNLFSYIDKIKYHSITDEVQTFFQLNLSDDSILNLILENKIKKGLSNNHIKSIIPYLKNSIKTMRKIEKLLPLYKNSPSNISYLLFVKTTNMAHTYNDTIFEYFNSQQLNTLDSTLIFFISYYSIGSKALVKSLSVGIFNLFTIHDPLKNRDQFHGMIFAFDIINHDLLFHIPMILKEIFLNTKFQVHQYLNNGNRLIQIMNSFSKTFREDEFPSEIVYNIFMVYLNEWVYCSPFEMQELNLDCESNNFHLQKIFSKEMMKSKIFKNAFNAFKIIVQNAFLQINLK